MALHTTRLRPFLLVATLAAILGVVVASSATAAPTPGFTVYPHKVAVGEPVTLTDATWNPDGYALTYEWEVVSPPPIRKIGAGDPACRNPQCSQVQVTFAEPAQYSLFEIVRWPGGPEGGFTAIGEVRVVDSAHAPAPITLASPTTVSLPTTLEILSPKPHMWISACNQAAWLETDWQECQPYLAGRTGPDSQGRYHFQFKLPLAAQGSIELEVEALSNYSERPGGEGDQQVFTINVTGDAYQFGDVQSCFWPVPRNEEGEALPGQNVYALKYYATMSTSAVLKLQVKRGKRWITRKQRQASVPVSPPVNPLRPPYPPAGGSPWTQRELQAKFGPTKYLWRKRRAIYEIWAGSKLVKWGHLSTQHCTVVP